MLTKLIAGGISSLVDAADDWFTTDEERLHFKVKLQQIQTEMLTASLDHDAKLVAAQSAIIQAEANGKSWIQRSWRPILMLTFGALIVADFMGLTAPNMSEAIKLSLYELMKIGIGGYIVGRSAEKTVPGLLQMWRDSKNATNSAPGS